MTAFEIVCLGLEAPADAHFREAMRPELQRRLLECAPADWELLLAEWPRRSVAWCGQLVDVLSPSKHGQAALGLLLALTVEGPVACMDDAAQKLIASQALNATERALVATALTTRGRDDLGRLAALQREDLLLALGQATQGPRIQEACEFAADHRAALAESLMAACYYCQTVFPTSLISEFTDGQRTALCPYCGTDAVLPSAAGYDFTAAGLLALNEFWFI
jgi:hypothetical protein